MTELFATVPRPPASQNIPILVVDHPVPARKNMTLDQVRGERDAEALRQQGPLMEPHFVGQLRERQFSPAVGERPQVAAIAEFGEPDLVTASFVRQAPGRRAAWALLGSGPVVGGCWAASLVAGRAWTWPVPLSLRRSYRRAPCLRAAFGVTLLAVITLLILAATGRHSYQQTRIAAGASIGVISLDAAILTTILLIAPPLVWPMALAVPASLTRMALTARAIPRLLDR